MQNRIKHSPLYFEQVSNKLKRELLQLVEAIASTAAKNKDDASQHDVNIISKELKAKTNIMHDTDQNREKTYLLLAELLTKYPEFDNAHSTKLIRDYMKKRCAAPSVDPQDVPDIALAPRSHRKM